MYISVTPAANPNLHRRARPTAPTFGPNSSLAAVLVSAAEALGREAATPPAAASTPGAAVRPEPARAAADLLQAAFAAAGCPVSPLRC